MSTAAADITTQLLDDLDNALTSPVRSLLGLDVAEAIEERIRARAPLLAAQLCQDDDDRLAAQTAIDIMGALWPHCAPEECGEAGWWRTPLGRMCARSFGHDDSDAVTYSVAAAMLGVHPGTVAQMIHRANTELDRHPDGGIIRASVLMRLAR